LRPVAVTRSLAGELGVVLLYILSAFYVLICLVLLLVVLLQQGRGGDIASAFGGSSSQAVFGARSGATLLTKATSVLAALFMLSALALAIMRERGPSSVVGGVALPASQGAPARPAPAQTPAPAKPGVPQQK
jgi:preprotein translocase subunit SecG